MKSGAPGMLQLVAAFVEERGLDALRSLDLMASSHEFLVVCETQGDE